MVRTATEINASSMDSELLRGWLSSPKAWFKGTPSISSAGSIDPQACECLCWGVILGGHHVPVADKAIEAEIINKYEQHEDK